MAAPTEIAPSKPEVSASKEDQTEAGILTRGAMSMNDLSDMLAREITHVNALETALTQIEGDLFCEENLKRIVKKEDPREMMALYALAIQRKESAQRFVMRMMELGIKSNILTRMLDGAGPKPVSGRTLPKPTRELTELKAELQKIMDSKIGIGVTGGHTV